MENVSPFCYNCRILTKGKNLNTVYCDFYEICGTATYVNDSDLEFYNDGYQCAECFDQMDAEFYETIGWSDADALASAGFGMDEDY